MGNHHSVPSGVKLPSLGRTGSLGLSKSELEKRCKPSGIYPSCKWEDRAIRRLIGDGKLAARLPGKDSRTGAKDRECPICFLHYSQTNVTSCCKAFICTECYLQVRPQKEKHSSCPFCNHNKVTVKVAKDMNSSDIIKRNEEEQCVIEAMIKAQNNREVNNDPAPTASSSTSNDHTEEVGLSNENPTDSLEFGAQLQKQQNEWQRSRNNSFDIEGLNESGSIALSPEERHLLEEEMRAQHNHPLSLSMRREAEQRREENEREFFRQHGHRLSSYQRGLLFGAAAANGNFRLSSRQNSLSRSQLNQTPRLLSIAQGGQSGSRDWSQLVEAFQSTDDTDTQSFDDIVLLEAALLMSMEDQLTRRSENQTTERGSNADSGESTNNASSAASEEPNEQEVQRSSSSEDIRSRNDYLQEFTSRRSRRRQRYDGNRNSDLMTDVDWRGIINSRIGRNSRNFSASEILVPGISEEEQVALAIALSLREDQANQERQTNVEESNNPQQEQSSSESSENVNNSNESQPPNNGNEFNIPATVSENNANTTTNPSQSV